MHWSLAAKSAALALAFLYSPAVFAALALGVYVIPWFRTREFLAPFILLVLLGYAMPAGMVSGLAVGAMFYLFLGVKELAFVDRALAYETLTLFACFVFAFALFHTFDRWGDAPLLLASFAVGIFFFVLERGRVRNGNRADEHRAPPSRAMLGEILLALMVTESFLILAFLPVSFLHQTALFAIMFAISFELTHAYLRGGLTSAKILTAASAFIGLSAITLTAVEWSVR